ncbi:MAG: hypothetical protein MUF15_19980, partial [Acidobacteria bacterium]|nr:hypothetical protein [Acidobacteriota bacterium]
EIQEITENSSDAKVTFKLEKEIDLPNIIYASITLGEDKLLIHGYDMRDKTACPINLYDLNLNLIKSYSLPVGQGPGDISQMTFLFIKENLIYAIDLQNFRICIFEPDANMKLLKINRLKEPIFLPYLSEDFNYIAFSKSQWLSNHKYRYDIFWAKFPSWENSYKFDEIISDIKHDKNKREILGEDPFVDYFFKNNYFYALDMTRYILTKTGLNSGKAEKKRVNVKPIKINVDVAEEERIIKLLMGSRANRDEYTLAEYLVPTSWMIPLGKGFAVIRRHNFEQEKAGEVEVEADYFDYDLHMIGKIKMPYFFRYNSFRFPGLSYYKAYTGNYFFTIEDSDENWKLKKWYVDESKIPPNP